tara:strand:+ start:1488 stop:5069 length:3582 start_codon:yes stop_codon:yes gene_type:complete
MDNTNSNDELFKDIDKSEIPWMIINSYFKNNHLQQLIKHQLESYNNFIELEINKTVEMFNPLVICSENDYIKEHDLYRLKIEINFKNLALFRPQIYENNGATKILFPQEARTRNFTYSSALMLDLDIEYIVTNGEDYKNVVKYKKMLKNINFGRIPVMLKSNICVLSQYKQLSTDETYECYMDPGGYFIINGSEKTVLGQERASENKIYCFNISKNSTKWSWISEIKCVPDWKCISPKQINLMIATKNNGFGNAIYLQIPRLKNPIPLFIIFRAFNIISDKEICEKILINIDDKIIENNKERKKLLYYLKASIVDANTCLTQDDAIKYVLTSIIYNPINIDKEAGLKKKRDYTLDVLDNDIFPNCKCNNKKIYMLGYMTNILLKTYCGLLPPSDRDSYINKKIDLTGNLLNNLFRNYFNKLVKDMVKQITKEINNGSWKSNENYENIINNTNIYKIVKSTTIENGIKRALATGDFGIKQLNTNKVGVAQVLNRLTYISSLSHLRRINTPIDKSGKLVPPRRLHNSSWGFLCPAETPEGASVGVVKNLSYLAHITIYSHSDALYEYVKKFIVNDKKINEVYYDVNNNYEDKVKVFINGIYQGVTDDPVELYYDLKTKKYRGILNIYTSIIFDTKLLEIRVCNEAGRLTRPLLKLKDRKPLYNKYILDKMKNNTLNFYDLLITINDNESIVEYVDAIEQEHILIAMNEEDLIKNKNYKYTHMEIHPSSIFGILASCIPFPENNQSPRNTYQSAMGKQAMGMYVTNFQSRMDKTAYVLTYPMRPLVDTRIMNILKLNTIPSGCQVIVAIASYTGYNQEDSILFNKGSIDRGLFSATIYHTEKDEDKKLFGNEETRCKPDSSKTKNMKFANYNKLNSNGVIDKDKLVEDRDVIIGKIAPIKENKNDFTKTIKFQDESRIYRTNEETYIDKNLINKNGDGYNFCKVRLRNYRKPTIGDKFSSRHGQKGTIGNIIPEEDMPFTADGIRPDIIINPHAIPSRMTIAQLKETILGKVLLQLGLFGDGTSFNNLDISFIIDQLQNVGFESTGNEVMYDALSGEQLESNIFIGPAFYQRLKHMVNDKQHSRSIGPMVNLTRQPAEGRSRDGGLRFGEMERDAMISHGTSRFTKDRLYNSSDCYNVHVCNKCGMICQYNEKESIYKCKYCDNKTDFKYIEIPYACKLLFQELISMNIAPRILCE